MVCVSVATVNAPRLAQPVVQMHKSRVVRSSQPKIVPLGQRKHFVSGSGQLLLAYTSVDQRSLNPASRAALARLSIGMNSIK
jgi:hypothetical protein